MESNKYKILLIFRIILLLANLMAIAFLVVQLKWFFTSSLLGTLLVIQTIDLFRFNFKIKTDLDNLIRSFEHNDFSTKSLTIDYTPKFKESEDSLQRIKTMIENSRIEKELQFNFLKILVENVPSGIIVLKENNLYLSNKSAKDILQLNELRSLRIIKTNYPEFYQIISDQNHLQTELISLQHNSQTIQLSFSISSIILLNEKAKIINFQNIKTALEKNELLAWNKLIRTMTHEIMNSVTPLISLSETGYSISSYQDRPKELNKLTQKNIDHIYKSFKSIHNKSVWLKEFIEDYRKLIRIPQPKITSFKLKLFIDDIIESLNTSFQNEKIKIVNTIDNLEINADKNLIELVIVNLLKNALDALKKCENKLITFSATQSESTTIISITDSGIGIPEDIVDQIFVPFFSTKENGSGIGLSVVKQIIQMHNGYINVISKPGYTKFNIQLK